LPPLIYTREQAQLLVDTLVPLISDFLAHQSQTVVGSAQPVVQPV
jgi:hypothetical protein